MKKLFLLLMFIPLISFSQSLSELDKLNGFKSLKLGDSKDLFSNNLILTKKNGEYSTYKYSTSNPNLSTLFGNKYESMLLTFENLSLKLVEIKLDFTKKHKPNYMLVLPTDLEKLYNNFKLQIGPATIPYTINEASLYELALDGEILWKAKNVILKIKTKVDIDTNPATGQLELINNKIISFSSR